MCNIIEALKFSGNSNRFPVIINQSYELFSSMGLNFRMFTYVHIELVLNELVILFKPSGNSSQLSLQKVILLKMHNAYP